MHAVYCTFVLCSVNSWVGTKGLTFVRPAKIWLSSMMVFSDPSCTSPFLRDVLRSYGHKVMRSETSTEVGCLSRTQVTAAQQKQRHHCKGTAVVGLSVA